jgi:hypothetical protein
VRHCWHELLYLDRNMFRLEPLFWLKCLRKTVFFRCGISFFSLRAAIYVPRYYLHSVIASLYRIGGGASSTNFLLLRLHEHLMSRAGLPPVIDSKETN